MNVIARLEYELAYYDSAVHRFNHYTTRTPLSSKVEVLILLFTFILFYSVVSRDSKVDNFANSLFFFFFFFCWLLLGLVSWTRLGDLCVCQSPILLLLFTHKSFSHQRKLLVFHWRLSDSKSPQVSRTLPSIQAVFNNAVVRWSPLGRQLPNPPGPLIIL